MSCPVCGSPDAEGDVCPRCGTDLRLLAGVSGEARLEIVPVHEGVHGGDGKAPKRA